MKLSRRKQHIVNRINNGSVLITGQNYVILSTPISIRNEPDENIQISLFLRMVNDGVFYQQLHPPFYYVLSDEYMVKNT